MDSSNFTYSPLVEQDAFRLLLLDPAGAAGHQSDLRGTLLHATLADCDYELVEPYTALSYVWGDPKETGSIYLDGTLVVITKTLDAALRDVRDQTRVRRVWADALCIDQSNIPERNRQVSLMGLIYSVADHTVIHLGELTPGVKRVLDATSRSTINYYVSLDEATQTEIERIASQEVLTRPWFRRVWIFQELVLSRDPWVQCGQTRVRWSDMCDLLLRRRPGGGEVLEILHSMNLARQGSNAGSMLSLLKARRGFGATDPRDMIYAHLGIIGDKATVSEYIEVDYTKTTAYLYSRFAQYILDSHGAEALISLVNSGLESRPTNLELPSWVPDWTWSQPATGGEMYKNTQLFHANLQGPTYAYTEHGSSLVLGCVGYWVGEISETSGIFPFAADLPNSELENCRQAAALLTALYSQAGGVYWSGDPEGQYMHISLKGRQEEHQRLSRSLADSYMELFTAVKVALPEGLATWFERAITMDSIFIGQASQGLLRIFFDYAHRYPGASVLGGHRLARTKDGNFGVVPFASMPGDHVINLAGSEISVVASPTKLSDAETREVQEQLENSFAGLETVLEIVKPGGAPGNVKLWNPALDPKMPAQHFKLVAPCYIDGEVPWALARKVKPAELKLFALY